MVELPYGWYTFGSHNGTYVETQSFFAGFEVSAHDAIGTGATVTAVAPAATVSAKAAFRAMGEFVGAYVLAADVMSWTRWDTTHIVKQGLGPMPQKPVPTPPVQ